MKRNPQSKKTGPLAKGSQFSLGIGRASALCLRKSPRFSTVKIVRASLLLNAGAALACLSAFAQKRFQLFQLLLLAQLNGNRKQLIDRKKFLFE